MRLLRGEIEQRANCSGSALARAQLEHLAEQHQRGNYRRGLEINGHPSVHVTEGRRKNLREDGCDYAVEICGASPQADQREHVGRAIHKRGPKSLKERPAAPEHNRSRKSELDPVKGCGHKVQAERLAEHPQNEQRHGKHGADPEAQTHGVVFRVRFYFGEHIHGLERHAADRASAGADLDNLRMHRAGVADLLIAGGPFRGWLTLRFVGSRHN